MKSSKFLFKLIIYSLISSNLISSDFCNGFLQGYKTGYKQKKQSTFVPFLPVCPVEPVKKFGDPKSNFEFGYTVGFKTSSK